MLTNALLINNVGPMGILLIAIVVLVLFGRGKISSLMGEVGKGITSFKKGVAEGNKDDEEETAAVQVDPSLNDSATVRDITPEPSEKDKA
ncbi:twin-arginine translocase TatA/TatE family subunit [Jannaschia marina]|uniref:twin-arginine translocase TatA/TatE family subunit n=1 Tax=Jannaschia marina TaxID=2741674 RepID=UPI0015C9B903|nr:twin-arginine translocase TatA/TatE family subunit [Jannaschia marina]